MLEDDYSMWDDKAELEHLEHLNAQRDLRRSAVIGCAKALSSAFEEWEEKGISVDVKCPRWRQVTAAKDLLDEALAAHGESRD